MDAELFSTLEEKVEAFLDAFAALKQENERLRGENRRLLEERNGFKARIDAILVKLEGI
jgi:cell division protein ZapB